MGTHTNGDGSVSEGVKVEAPGKFVSHELALDATAVATLTVPACAVAIVQADGADIRFTLDGSAPAAGTGLLIKNGTSQALSVTDAAAAKFIGGKINAWYTL